MKGDCFRSAVLQIALVAIVALVVNSWALWQNGLGNAYYAATTRSMTTSWHNFTPLDPRASRADLQSPPPTS